MLPKSAETTIDHPYEPILLDSLRLDSILDFDLYLDVQGKKVLYRSADLPFTEQTQAKLLEGQIVRLYIKTSNHGQYQRYIEKNLGIILEDPKIEPERKAGILYETSANLVKDVMAKPTVGDNIHRSEAVVSQTIGYILQGQDAFHSLLKMTSYNYYLYTHAVNVCTYSAALAQQANYQDETFLCQLGIGALLHDVGKTKVSERILNKRSALSPTEFEIMRQHPLWGVELLAETDILDSESYYPVLQHHERGDGRGYPYGLSLQDIHLHSRIVSIADAFDAMTTNRVYQSAMDSFTALRIMMSVKGAYDPDLLQAFVALMGPSGLT